MPKFTHKDWGGIVARRFCLTPRAAELVLARIDADNPQRAFNIVANSDNPVELVLGTLAEIPTEDLTK